MLKNRPEGRKQRVQLKGESSQVTGQVACTVAKAGDVVRGENWTCTLKADYSGLAVEPGKGK